jgi:hypothetical protein
MPSALSFFVTPRLHAAQDDCYDQESVSFFQAGRVVPSLPTRTCPGLSSKDAHSMRQLQSR